MFILGKDEEEENLKFFIVVVNNILEQYKMLNISDIFLFEQVVKYGSFTKAANYSYLTPPALTHRINELEKQFGVKLFIRNPQGTVLTAAGKELHKYAIGLINENNQIIKAVQNKAIQRKHIIRIGSAVIEPATKLNKIWTQVLKQLPDFVIQYIPLETLDLLYPNFYQHLGEEVDIVFNPSGFMSTEKETNFIPLKNLHFQIGMLNTDPLVKKCVVSLNDLANKELIIPESNKSEVIDKLYREIKSRNLNIKLMKTDIHYTINTFNKFVQNGRYIITVPCWNNVLPGIVNKNSDIKTTIPYGLMTPKHPTPDVALFVKKLKEVLVSVSEISK